MQLNFSLKISLNLRRLSPMVDPKEEKPHVTLTDCIVDRIDFLDYEFPKREIILNPWIQAKSLTLVSGQPSSP
jgi:hypothetical protein